MSHPHIGGLWFVASTGFLALISEEFSLVFRRKHLCEARVKPKMSSYFQMRCTLRWADPPCETVSDSRSSIAWSMCSVRAHSKWSMELGQVSDEVYPQMSWPPHLKLSVTAGRSISAMRAHSKTVGGIRSSFQMTRPVIISDDLSTSRIRSSFQMTCSHQMRYPLVLTSCGQEEYYKRSSGHSDIFRGVLQKVILTFSYFQTRCTLRWPPPKWS